MNSHLLRALLLIDQSRFDVAQKELQQSLLEDPDDADTHSVLALCLVNLKEYQRAEDEAKLSIHLAPDSSHPYFVFSIVLFNRNRIAEARKFVEKAIALQPFDVDYFAHLAQIEISTSQWDRALGAANRGLEVDPEDIRCQNLQAIALARMGRQGQAKDVIAMTLERAPEDALTHANMGWALIEQRQSESAMKHFREALRLEPNFEWARLGIVEAMRSKYAIYRVMLSWFLWMKKLQRRSQLMIVFGAYIVYVILGRVAKFRPECAPYIRPVLILYVVFVALTWLADPLFNLLLRTHRFGRLALSNQEIRTSTWVGVCVMAAFLSLIALFWTDRAEFQICALACCLIVIPISAIFSAEEGWPRATLSLMTIALSFLACIVFMGSFVGAVVHGPLSDFASLVVAAFLFPFLASAVVAQIATNLVVSARPKRGSRSGQLTWWIGGSVLGLGAIIAIGFIGLLSVAYWESKRPVFAGPLRLHSVIDERPSWKNVQHVDELTQTLQGRGFDQHFDYRYQEKEGHSVRALTDARKEIWIELSEDKNYHLYVTITSCYDNGTYFIYSNSPNEITTMPPHITMRYLDIPPAPLYERFLQDRPQHGLRSVEFAEFLDLSNTLYADFIDFLLQRGGPTHEELEQFVKRQGGEISEKQIALLQRRWKKQASDQLHAFVVSQWKQQHPEYDKIDDDRWVCIHDLLSAADLVRYRRRFDLDLGGDVTLETVQNSIETQGCRRTFALWVREGKQKTLLNSAERPLPHDLYLFPRE